MLPVSLQHAVRVIVINKLHYFVSAQDLQDLTCFLKLSGAVWYLPGVCVCVSLPSGSDSMMYEVAAASYHREQVALS